MLFSAAMRFSGFPLDYFHAADRNSRHDADTEMDERRHDDSMPPREAPMLLLMMFAPVTPPLPPATAKRARRYLPPFAARRRHASRSCHLRSQVTPSTYLSRLRQLIFPPARLRGFRFLHSQPDISAPAPRRIPARLSQALMAKRDKMRRHAAVRRGHDGHSPPTMSSAGTAYRALPSRRFIMFRRPEESTATPGAAGFDNASSLGC
jgi:hypothetical protein